MHPGRMRTAPVSDLVAAFLNPFVSNACFLFKIGHTDGTPQRVGIGTVGDMAHKHPVPINRLMMVQQEVFFFYNDILQKILQTRRLLELIFIQNVIILRMKSRIYLSWIVLLMSFGKKSKLETMSLGLDF